MKRIAFIALLATVLAGFLVFVPSTQTTHAAANCSKYDGILWRLPLPPSKFVELGTIDLWPCLTQDNNGDPNNDVSYAHVSFRLKNVEVSSCTIKLRDGNSSNAVSRDCTQDAQNHTIGAFYWGGTVKASNGYATAVAYLSIQGYVRSANKNANIFVYYGVDLNT